MAQIPDMDDAARILADRLGAVRLSYCGSCGAPLAPKRTVPGNYGCPCVEPDLAGRLMQERQRRDMKLTPEQYADWRAGHEGRIRAVRLLREAFGEYAD